MPTYRDEVRDLVIGTVWSQWAELGLSGWERQLQDVAIDLEALIVATARLGSCDARLKAEALDWCVANGRLASAVRIKHLLAAAERATQEAMGSFAATVNAHSRLTWPGATTPGSFAPTHRSSSPALERPALIQLRLRALWGVSARAEVIRVVLAEAGRFLGASEVAASAAYGKDAVAEALDSLHRGGMLGAATSGNQNVYQLAPERASELAAVVGAQPAWERSWPWRSVLPLMVAILEVAELPEMPPMARAAEVQARLRVWRPQLARLGIVTGALGTGDAFLGDYQRFTVRALRRWAGHQPVPA